MSDAGDTKRGEMSEIEWTLTPRGNWQAKQIFAKGWSVAYTIWGDEDNMWYGEYEYRQPAWGDGSEWSVIELPWRCLPREQLQQKVSEWHETTVKPSVLAEMEDFTDDEAQS